MEFRRHKVVRFLISPNNYEKGKGKDNRSHEFISPETHSIKDGKGENKFRMTVAPQKLICPKGNT